MVLDDVKQLLSSLLREDVAAGYRNVRQDQSAHSFGIGGRVHGAQTGIDRTQQPMMCFAGRTLGGTDFCAERCQADDGAGAGLMSSAGGICSQSGARLASCEPAVAAAR